MRQVPVKLNPGAANWLDRTIAMISPSLAAQRLHAKATFAAMGGYDGARPDGRKRRRKDGSTDDQLLPDLPDLRDASYDLWRNAPLARGAVNTQLTNVVGTGLRLHTTMDREVLKTRLGFDDPQIDGLERAAEREFRLWAGSKDADVTRSLRFDEQQALVLAEVLLGGDVFVIPRFVERPGVPYALAMEFLDAARVMNPGFKQDSPALAGGVEKDEWGAPVAYHVSKMHPGSIGFRASEVERMPAFSDRTGRRLVRHVFRKVLNSQTRGEPYLAAILEPLEDLKKYTKNEIKAAVVASIFTVFIKRTSGFPADESASGTGGPFSIRDDRDNLELGSGAVAELGPGESIETATPGRPSTAFDPFVLAILRQIGVALDLPHEVLIKHFTASYSASQAAIMEAWKSFRVRSAWLAADFCQPCYEDLISEAVARRRLDFPGFFGDFQLRQAYLTARWVPPPRLQIRQDQEVAAAENRVGLGISSLATETAELTGADWEAVHAQRAKERRMRVTDGLEPPFPGASTIKPAASATNREGQS